MYKNVLIYLINLLVYVQLLIILFNMIIEIFEIIKLGNDLIIVSIVQVWVEVGVEKKRKKMRGWARIGRGKIMGVWKARLGSMECLGAIIMISFVYIIYYIMCIIIFM